MLTPSAARFVGPLTFAALSRHPVETDLLDLLPDGRIGHIVVADTADAIVVAPATAHWLGAMANGLAGDVVTATCLAIVGAGRRRPGDGRRHVDASRDPDERRPPRRRLRLRDRPARRRVRWRPASPAWAAWPRSTTIVDAVVAAVTDRPIRAADRRGASARSWRRPSMPTSRAATSSSPRAGRARPSIRSGSSAIARPAAWAWRSPKAALDRGARVTLVAAAMDVAPAGWAPSSCRSSPPPTCAPRCCG